jgi:hypothetical protein
MSIYVCNRAAALFNQRLPLSFLLIIEHFRIAGCFPGDYKFASQPVWRVQENVNPFFALVINRYFSICGRQHFQFLRELFLLIFGFKNSKRYQIAVSDFGSELRSQKCHILAFDLRMSRLCGLTVPLHTGNPGCEMPFGM